jgi:hypothetical protein
MLNSTNIKVRRLTKRSLSKFDNATLVDLLDHRTQLLLSASISKLSNNKYIAGLKKEVKAVQLEIQFRKENRD